MQVSIGAVAGQLVMPAIEFEHASADAPGMSPDEAAEVLLVELPARLVAVREHHVPAVGDTQSGQVATPGRDAGAQG
ncbi:MAG: hypothetical protein U5R48_17900 [Gammaproteobacteria bacterium]|nr:hypothetical protein [Gammaproteobacteria bacterium]